MVPGFVITSMGRRVPWLIGRSGSSMMSSGDATQPSVIGALQLTKPLVCGAESEKSKRSVSSPTVRVQRSG
jgi:hypothetical protein